MAQRFIGKVAKFKKGVKYQGGKGGLLEIYDLAEQTLPGLYGGQFFAYLFRRFGIPTFGSDDYKELTNYYLKTPIKGLFLQVSPYMGYDDMKMNKEKSESSSLMFGYLMSSDLANAILQEKFGPGREWSRRAAAWYHENRPDQIHPSFFEVKNELGETWNWFEHPEYELHNVVDDDGTEHPIRPLWEAAREAYIEIEPIPEMIENWQDFGPDSLTFKCCKALETAMKDLLRPVCIRDFDINCYGLVTHKEGSKLPSGAPYHSFSGTGIRTEYIEDKERYHAFNKAVSKIGAGNFGKGMQKIIKMAENH